METWGPDCVVISRLLNPSNILVYHAEMGRDRRGILYTFYFLDFEGGRRNRCRKTFAVGRPSGAGQKRRGNAKYRSGSVQPSPRQVNIDLA